jgi:hypothetical protein
MSLTSRGHAPSELSTFTSKRAPIFLTTTKHRTLDYYFSKQCYKRQLKRLADDPSSIWHDNLEQMKKDYADMKEIYDLACTV